MSDIFEFGRKYYNVPFTIKQVFFAPAHLKRKHFFETNLSEKLSNTQNIMLGIEPDGKENIPYHASLEINHPSMIRRAKEVVLKLGLIDVLTLGVFIIIPSITNTIVLATELMIYSSKLKPLVWLFAIPIILANIAATLLHAISLIIRYSLGKACTAAMSPLVLSIHALSSHFSGNEPISRKDMPTSIVTTLNALDVFIKDVRAHNLIQINLSLDIDQNKLVIAPVFNQSYHKILLTDEYVDADDELYHGPVPRNGIVESKFEPIPRNVSTKFIDCTDAFLNNRHMFIDVLKAYEHRGLIKINVDLDNIDLDSTLKIDTTCLSLRQP